MDKVSIKIYNDHAQQFADKWDSGGARIHDIERAFELASKQKPCVVELGCGSGRDAVEILKRTPYYTGMDATPNLLTIAKGKSPSGHFVLSTFEEFEAPKNSTDIVFAFATLIHCDKYEITDVLRKVHTWLTPGGIFYISLKEGSYGQKEITDSTGTRFNYLYQPEDIQQLSKDLLETVEVDKQDLRGQKWFTIILRKVTHSEAVA